MKTKESKKKKNASQTESEKKSHSVWSNTKLTFISFIALLSFSGLFVLLGIKDIIPLQVFYIGTVACSVFIVLTLFLFMGFKR